MIDKDYIPLNDEVNLPDIISSELFRQLRSLNLIDVIELRNLQIREEYKSLRLKNSSPVCIQILMDKYFVSDTFQ